MDNICKFMGEEFTYKGNAQVTENINTEDVIYLTLDNVKKTPEGKCLDELGLNKICCRRHMLTHVYIE